MGQPYLGPSINEVGPGLLEFPGERPGVARRAVDKVGAPDLDVWTMLMDHTLIASLTISN